jgi:hypothetical protein
MAKMRDIFQKMYKNAKINKKFAPGEDRTHGLQIMRLTRCLLRYGGLVIFRVFDDLFIISGFFRENTENGKIWTQKK